MATADGQTTNDQANLTLSAEAWRTTRFSDVCGGTDEFKRLLVEESAYAATAEGRATLRGLIDDGMLMLARMEVRLREYQAYRDRLAQLVEQMRTIPEPRLADAAAEAERLRHTLASDGVTGTFPIDELIERAEEIRQVANDMEGALRRHKEAAIAAARAYLELRGPRDWGDGIPALHAGGDDRQTERGGAGEPIPSWIPAAWLPPPPHRERIVDWLMKGRAALLSEAEAARWPEGPQGPEPLVQFEDGGVMPLRIVRWSDEVRNFYPLGQEPHPRGRLYRGRSIPAAPGGVTGG